MSILLGQVTGAIYYVVPTIGNQSCPTDQECHTLSYYINYISLPSNVSLLFLNGEHILNEYKGLQIKGLNNVALLGQGQWVQGFHWSVMQSSVIIKCANIPLAIYVSATTAIQISGLTFANCDGGIFITTVSYSYFNNLSVQNSSNFGLRIYNTTAVTIDSCSFSHNGANVMLNLVKTVSISYSNFTFGCCHYYSNGLFIQTDHTSTSSSINVAVKIIGCLVYSNTGNTVGGANVYSHVSGHHTLIIENTIFQNNNGNKGNGGLTVHLIVQGHSEIIINRVRFLYNKCTGADTSYTGSGGALIFVNSGFWIALNIENTTFIENNPKSLNLSLQGVTTVQATIKDTIFSFNFGAGGLAGGAFIYITSDYYYASVSLYICNTKFDSNTGVALHIHGNAILNMTDVYITKTFSINDLQQSQIIEGALQLICLSVKQIVTLSNVHIINNNMTGLWVEGCQVYFTDKPSIIANNKSPGNGGGIFAKRNSILSSIDAPVYLINNTATQYGGAIYSTANLVSTFIARSLYYGIDCTFYNFIGTFSDNYAHIAGNDIYGGYYYDEVILPCFDDVVKCNYHNLQSVACFSKILSSSSISSAPLGACICINNSYIDCNQRVLYKEVYPGQIITHSLVTVGMCGGISPGSIVTKGTSVNLKLDETDQITDIYCKNFTYQVKANSTSTEGKITIQTSGSLQLNGSILTINITLLPCPLGLVLDKLLGICVCDDIINAVKPQCNVSWMPYPIKRSGNNWLSYNNKYNCIIAHTNCPFDYCNTSLISLNLNNTDLQCTHKRSGYLCGQCKPGLSVVIGSNECSKCNNTSLFLLVLFALAGILLTVLLLKLNMTVSSGTINGLLFYANIVKLDNAVLLPIGSIPLLTQYIAWLNLDLGITTCFFNGFNGYWKTWLQFAFPLYLWLLVGGIIIGCHYSGRLSRLFGNNGVPTLATIILMSYTKVFNNIAKILMMSKLKCDKKEWNVWSVDGNIDYLTGKHIPLVCVSLLCLFVGIIYTGLIFSSQWLQRYSNNCCRSSSDPVIKLKPFIDAYVGPLKDRFQYWPGLLLIARVVLITALFFTTGEKVQVNNYIIVIIVGILLIVSNGVYRENRLTILDQFHLVNLGSLSLINALSDHLQLSISSTVYIVSVSMSLVVFVGTVLNHLYVLIDKRWSCKFPHFSNKYEVLNQEESQSSEGEEQYSPARVINRRESLIFDFDINEPS